MANINIINTSVLPVSPGLPPALRPPISSGNNATVGPAIVNNYDELSSLLPFILKNNVSDSGVSFPGTEFKEVMSNDLAVYKYPNRNGGRIDNMGNNPKMWTIKAILTNNIYPGLNESWKAGTLFPAVFKELISLLDSPGSKILQHPLFGNIPIQVQGYETEFIAKGPRDGAYVLIHLIKTIADGVAPSPGATFNLNKSGLAVTNAINSVGPDFPPPPGLSLGQFFSQLSSAIQNVVNYPSDIVGGLIDQTLIITTALNGFPNSIAQGLNQSLFYLTQSSNALITSLKSAPADSPLATIQNINDLQNDGMLTPQPLAPIFALNAAASLATQNILAINNNSSKNAGDFISKAITAVKTLHDYYINMNRVEVSAIIASLRIYLYSLQQTAATIQNNSNTASSTQSTKMFIATYITKNYISWYSLSRLLNNDINDLFSLNQTLSPTVLIPNNTSINYFQGSNQ